MRACPRGMIATGLGRRPVRKDEEEQLQDVLADTHDSFKQAVREARGGKIAGVSEEELWSGRVWTGRQATLLGLTDGVARLEDKMREKVGDDVSGSPPLGPHTISIHSFTFSFQEGSLFTA